MLHFSNNVIMVINLKYFGTFISLFHAETEKKIIIE